ncbi:hypothetical protein AKJ27_03210 [Corynebacterium glutamicum]|nr:hypothetical protein AKJ27_03210 [Corynebacterium glutamicum]
MILKLSAPKFKAGHAGGLVFRKVTMISRHAHSFSTVDSIPEFIEKWSNWLRQNDFELNDLFETSGVPEELRSTAHAIIKSAWFASEESDAPVYFDTSRVILAETIFADTETRKEVLDRLLETYQATLISVATQLPVVDTTSVHVTYCSVDKVEEFIALSWTVKKLNSVGSHVKFLLIPYQHPREGYPKPANGHIDAIMLPNKFREENFAALHKIASRLIWSRFTHEPTQIVRIGIDDDDQWLPWAFKTISSIATKALNEGGRSIKAVGIGTQLIYYPTNFGEIDLVDMNVVITGSKFYVSRNLQDIEKCSPYALPESYTTNTQRAFRLRKTDLMITRNAPPIHIYIRSSGTLSSMRKDQHYISDANTVFSTGTHREAVHAAVSAFGELANFSMENVVFSVDPPTLSAHGKFEPSSSMLQITGNFEEFLSNKGVSDYLNMNAIISYGTDLGRNELTLPLEYPLQCKVEDWNQRTLLRLEDKQGNTVGSAWVRGTEIFLS